MCWYAILYLTLKIIIKNHTKAYFMVFVSGESGSNRMGENRLVCTAIKDFMFETWFILITLKAKEKSSFRQIAEPLTLSYDCTMIFEKGYHIE